MANCPWLQLFSKRRASGPMGRAYSSFLYPAPPMGEVGGCSLTGSGTTLCSQFSSLCYYPMSVILHAAIQRVHFQKNRDLSVLPIRPRN